MSTKRGKVLVTVVAQKYEDAFLVHIKRSTCMAGQKNPFFKCIEILMNGPFFLSTWAIENCCIWICFSYIGLKSTFFNNYIYCVCYSIKTTIHLNLL